MEKKDNYRLQAAHAKQLFLQYDQHAIIRRCALQADADYLYFSFLGAPYRIHRRSGDLTRLQNGHWTDGNSFHEVMTVLDWLCDSKHPRYASGNWINIVSHGHYFHGELQEKKDPTALYFDQNPQVFCQACQALGGEKHPSADISYTIPFLDDLKILIQLWHGDEEFPPRLRLLWDENTHLYLRYETTWYASALLLQRLAEQR